MGWTQYPRCDLSLASNYMTGLMSDFAVWQDHEHLPQSCSSVSPSQPVILQEVIPSWVRTLHLSLSKKCAREENIRSNSGDIKRWWCGLNQSIILLSILKTSCNFRNAMAAILKTQNLFSPPPLYKCFLIL